MPNSKATPKTARELGLTPHEERLLKAYFRQQTRPYLAGLLIVGAVIGVLMTLGLPASPGSDETSSDASQQIELATAELRSNLDTELVAMREQLASLSGGLEQLREDSAKVDDRGMLGRINAFDGQLSRLGSQIKEIEKQGIATRRQIGDLGKEIERKLVDSALRAESTLRSSRTRPADAASADSAAEASESDLAFE